MIVTEWTNFSGVRDKALSVGAQKSRTEEVPLPLDCHCLGIEE